MRAILSVSDKTGLVPFAQGLQALGAEIYSTGGTRNALTTSGVAVHSISDITGFPEILDGRVKTLHPAVHGGLLARRDLPDHMRQLKDSGITPIDLVAVNLYPFVRTVSRPEVTLEEALENIDIGGPTMIRAAAKNFPSVIVVVDPSDYEPVLKQLRNGGVSVEERKRLAQKAFQHVAGYDTAIARYLRQGEEAFPQELTLGMVKSELGGDLRYGENPHQKAAFYAELPIGSGTLMGIAGARQLGGKELSYNNIMDADAAWNIATDYEAPTVAIVKHTNPCGLASHDDLTEAYRRAFDGDPVSAFGGIVALNRPLDLATAQEIAKTFYEIVIAPAYDDEALKRLTRKRDLRVLVAPLPEPGANWLEVRRIRGGYLIQTPDALPEKDVAMRVVTDKAPAEAQIPDLLFAWRAAKHVKSNAIVIAKDAALLGMGAGQPNRVTSVELALKRAGEKAQGSVLASDAFFPFPDGVEIAAKGGVVAIIQPGGSIRDEEVIKAANEHDVAMVFTGVRHFRH